MDARRPTLRPFRFAVAISSVASAREWRDKLSRLSDLGYDAVHVPDHFGDYLSTGAALASAAALQPGLHITSLVYDNDFRHPTLLAQEAATLAMLSDGRFELGLGAGWLKAEYDRTGIPWRPGRERFDKLEEAVNVIAPLLRGEEVTFRGKHYQVEGLKILAPPRPPRVLIGAGGPRMLALAARHADIVSVLGRALPDGGLDEQDWSFARFRRKVEYLMEVAQGREDHIELHLLIQAVAVTEDRDREIERLAKEWEASPDEVADSPSVLIGSTEEIAHQVRERRRMLGFSYFTVFEEHMEAFAPVVRLCRTTEATRSSADGPMDLGDE